MSTLAAPAALGYPAPSQSYPQPNEYEASDYYAPVYLKCLMDRVGDHELTILSTGPNIVGPLRYFTGRVAKFGVDIRMTSGTPLGNRYSLSLYCYSGDKTRLDALENYLGYKENLVIPAIPTYPVKTAWIRILAPSMPGVIDRVLKRLVARNITLAGVAGTTHPAARAGALGYPYADGVGDIAAIKIKIGLPAEEVEQPDHMENLQESIGAINPKWLVLLTDQPQRDLAPAWPGQGTQDYRASGDFKYATTDYDGDEQSAAPVVSELQ